MVMMVQREDLVELWGGVRVAGACVRGNTDAIVTAAASAHRIAGGNRGRLLGGRFVLLLQLLRTLPTN